MTYTPMAHFSRAALAALILVLAGCTASADSNGAQDGAAGSDATAAESRNERVVRVQVLRLEPTAFEDAVQLTGTAEAPNDATLSAQSGGSIVELAPLGRRVGRGDVVARLDDELVQAALRQARAELDVAVAQQDLAEDLLSRQEPLYRDSIISAVEFENVRSQLLQARAGVSRAEAAVQQGLKQLENTVVRAPFAGAVEERFAERGEQVLPGTPLLRVVDTRTLQIVAGVPERYATLVREGASATIRFQAAGAVPKTGVVSFASQVIDPQSRTFRVEIDLGNADGAVKPAMIANVFITHSQLQDRLVVPQTAVIREEDGSSVFVVETVDGQERAQRRPVVLGPSHGGLTVVESGLEAGDRVIIVGQSNVTEGDAVQIAPTRTVG